MQLSNRDSLAYKIWNIISVLKFQIFQIHDNVTKIICTIITDQLQCLIMDWLLVFKRTL